MNKAACFKSIAEAVGIAISSLAYLCLDQAQAKSFNNCAKQNLKNIATAVYGRRFEFQVPGLLEPLLPQIWISCRG